MCGHFWTKCSGRTSLSEVERLGCSVLWSSNPLGPIQSGSGSVSMRMSDKLGHYPNLGRGQFGLDCNAQRFEIPKGLNLVAVGELATPTDRGQTFYLTLKGVKPSCKCDPFRVRISSERVPWVSQRSPTAINSHPFRMALHSN